ncbi:hypothetical protein [Flagellimonas sp.]|uniref:hypothetical protein n=1 Tax=Flagellimonas sp. TaxID=2058762 RepID=UPI003AB859B9
MKRPSILLLITFLFGVFIVLALHIAAPKKENHKHAGFERVFAPEGTLVPLDTLDLGYNSYYIAGVDNSGLYLGNYTAFNHVIKVNPKDIKDTVHYKITADSIDKISGIKVNILNSTFYLIDGNMSFIQKGSIKDWVAEPFIKDTNFSRAIPISDSTLAVIKIYDQKNTFYTMDKEVLKMAKPQLLKEQYGDGLFTTDGKLYYDPNAELLVFIYFYRNQFLSMDKNFNLKINGYTIDTISKAKIKIGNIASKDQTVMTAPALIVNKMHDVSQYNLFINSNILSANEDTKTFETSSVIDVYDLANKGIYKQSFYIPALNEQKMDEFKVVNNKTIMVRYTNNILIYKLNLTNQN